MLRHEVRFVLRFGVMDELRQTLDVLAAREHAQGWAEPRCFRAAFGRVNELVIVHDYADRAEYDAQRDAYHSAADGEHTAALSALAQLMVPGTATEMLVEEL
jgi:hypothetical protein